MRFSSKIIQPIPHHPLPQKATTMNTLATHVLATSRLTRLVIDDKITEPIRNRLHDLNSPTLSYLITCPWCVSIWAASTLTLANQTLPPSLSHLLTQALALSEATGLIQSNL